MHDLDRVQLEAFDRGEQPRRTAGWSDDELVEQLLGVRDDDELDAFIGDLIGRAANASRRALRSDVAKSLGRVATDATKAAAKKAIPQLGKVVGKHASGPTGERIGASIASAALPWLGLEELEMADEDAGREVARAVIDVVSDATARAAEAPRDMSGARAAVAAATAAAAAQRQRRPRTRGRVPSITTTQRQRSGTWTRRGDQIVVTGA